MGFAFRAINLFALSLSLSFTGATLAAEREESQGLVIEQAELENGLKIYVIPDDRADVVTHMLWLDVGGGEEPRGKSGIAHLFEHLMFKGTEANPDGVFDRKVEEVGGRQNAFTSDDYTAYFQRVSSEYLGLMMSLEADRLNGLTLSLEDVATEAQVVVQERLQRVENQPGARLSEAMEAMLYVHHPYGTPVLGWQHEMESVTREDALAFYRKYYSPANARLIVAGNTTLTEVVALAQETYGRLPKVEKPKRERVREPDILAAREVTVTDERVEQPSWRRIHRVPSYHRAEGKEAFALDLLAYVLGGSRTSRLFQSLVQDQGRALSVGAWYRGTAYDQTNFGLYAVPREGVSLEEVEALVIAEVESVVRDGITEAELENAKLQQFAALTYSLDNSQGLARALGATLTTGGTVEDFLAWPDRLKEVTVEDLRLAAEKHLQAERSVSGYLKKPALEGAEAEAQGEEAAQ